jgi:hypothetical protein
MSVPKRVKKTRVLSTKVTERDRRFLQGMVDRYFEKGFIKQAKTSTLLRLIVKGFLRRHCPEYEQKTSHGYQQEINKLYSDPKRIIPQIQYTDYTRPSVANAAFVK